MTDHNDLAASATFAAPSTFADYWATVMGPDRDPAAVVREFDLAGGTRRDLDEWLGTAESEAWAVCKIEGDKGPRERRRRLPQKPNASW